MFRILIYKVFIMAALIINQTEITEDENGRFSLNDLHKAAGGLNKHKPALFYRSGSFNSVVEVLKVQNRTVEPIIKKKGRYNGGTWVCKELVYKYAMWVNAEFEVNVIQTFDALVSKANPPSSMAALNELTRRIESDKDVASFCGKELAKYKKVKKENELAFIKHVESAQLTLGFTGTALN
jgi:hypothetical protein